MWYRTVSSVDDADDTCQSSPGCRCTGCGQRLGAGDLVMRAHLSVFHSSCFSCCVCRRRLSRGQQFALVDEGRIYCRADYERRQAAAAAAVETTPAGDEASGARRDSDDQRGDEVKISPGPSTSTDDEALPSSIAVVKTVCRRRWRARKTTPSVHQDTSKKTVRVSRS